CGTVRHTLSATNTTSIPLSVLLLISSYFSFFFNDTATTEIYTLSLHDALPICVDLKSVWDVVRASGGNSRAFETVAPRILSGERSEEHTSELQSRENLVCRLLLEKKKKMNIKQTIYTSLT